MKRYLLVLYICLFVVMIGFGISLPVLPFYIERLALAADASPSLAIKHIGSLTGVFALMQFFFAPVWGKWSDRIGRRPLLLIGLGGYSISMLCFGMGSNLWMLYSTRIAGGISSAAILPVATAYVSDLTSSKERATGMAWLGSAISLGIVVGPAVGTLWLQSNLLAPYRIGPLQIDQFSLSFFMP